MKYIGITLLTALLYALFAWVELEFNPMLWHPISRAFTSLGLIVVFVLGIGLMFDKKK